MPTSSGPNTLGENNLVFAYDTGGTFATVPITTPRTNCYIGKSNWSADSYFQGYIPVVKIYNRALTAAEVRQNYQQYKTRFNLS